MQESKQEGTNFVSVVQIKWCGGIYQVYLLCSPSMLQRNGKPCKSWSNCTKSSLIWVYTVCSDQYVRIFSVECDMLSSYVGDDQGNDWAPFSRTWCLLFQASTMTVFQMGRAMRKSVFGHMQTAKAQISLCTRTVWSGPSLSASKIIGYYRTYKWRAKARMRLCACAGRPESAHLAHAWGRSFAWHSPYKDLVLSLISDSLEPITES